MPSRRRIRSRRWPGCAPDRPRPLRQRGAVDVRDGRRGGLSLPRGYGAIGSAPALQAGGYGFESR